MKRPPSCLVCLAVLLVAPPLRADLVSWWPFEAVFQDKSNMDVDEGPAGNDLDIVRGRDDGVPHAIKGVHAEAAGLSSGDRLGAAELRNGAGYTAEGSLTDLPIASHPRYTVAFWVRGSDPEAGSVIYGESNPSHAKFPHFVIGAAYSDPRHVRVALRNDDGENLLIFQSPAPYAALDGSWHHVAFTLSRSLFLNTARLYVDGREVAEEPFTGSRPGTLSTISIASVRKGDGFVHPCDCDLDELMVFDHDLTRQEIRGIARYRTDSLATWSFEGDLADGGPEAHHGIFSGSGVVGGGGTLLPSYTLGFDGERAISLNGLSRVEVDLPHTRYNHLPVALYDEYAIDLWVRGLPQTDRVIYGEGSVASPSAAFVIGTDPDQGDRVRVLLRDSNGKTLLDLRSEDVVFDGGWHHLRWQVGPYNSSQGTLHVDDRSRTAQIPDLDSLWLDTATIGALSSGWQTFTGHFRGAIDELRICLEAGCDGTAVGSLGICHPEGVPGHGVLGGIGLGSRLRSRWSFDGDLEDTGESALHGLVSGGPVLYDEGADGRWRGALRLDGDDFIDVSGGDPVHDGWRYSVSLRVKGLPQNRAIVYGEGSSESDTPFFRIGTEPTGLSGKADVFLRYPDGSGPGHMVSNRVVFDGTWHHIAWVVSLKSSDMHGALYIDGTLDSEFTYSQYSFTNSPVSLDRAAIGAALRSSACCFFSGSVDDLRLSTGALDPAEILALAGKRDPVDLEAPLNLIIQTEPVGEVAGTWETIEEVPGVAPVEADGAADIVVPPGEVTLYAAIVSRGVDQGLGEWTLALSRSGDIEIVDLDNSAEGIVDHGKSETQTFFGDGAGILGAPPQFEPLEPDGVATVLAITLSGEDGDRGSIGWVDHAWHKDPGSYENPWLNRASRGQGSRPYPFCSLMNARIHFRSAVHTQGPRFLRGDSNDDGLVDLTDPVRVLEWSFLGAAEPGCVAASNVNGDAEVDISDAVWSLEYQFLGGPPPVEPFPSCGPSSLEADENLGCASPPASCGP